MNDYDDLIAELKFIEHQCYVKKLDSLTKIFRLSEDCETCLPTANKLCRLGPTYNSRKYCFKQMRFQ